MFNKNKYDVEFERAVEKLLQQPYQITLDKLRLIISKIYEKYGYNVTYSQMQIYGRWKALEKQLLDELKKLHKDNIKIITSAIVAAYLGGYIESLFNIEHKTGIKIPNIKIKLPAGRITEHNLPEIVLNPVDTIKWVDRAEDSIKLLNKQIKEIIAQGLLQDKGYIQIARDIKGKTNISLGRALRISRTEIHRATSMGALKSFDKSKTIIERYGLKLKKIWLAVLDERTRFLHAEFNEHPADSKGLFHLPDGVVTLAPGLTGVPEHDINCRCVFTVEVITPQGKALKQSNIKNFKEWNTEHGHLIQEYGIKIETDKYTITKFRIDMLNKNL